MAGAPKRVWGLIDGFNWYYAIRDAISGGLCGPSKKWINYYSLVQDVAAQHYPGEVVTDVRWYTAPQGAAQTRHRHKWLRKALEAQGVNTVLGAYKRKNIKCGACGSYFPSWEEKATDVNLAIDTVSGAALNDYDTLLLFSGDSDLAPAVERARTQWGKEICVIVPAWRRASGGGPQRHAELTRDASKLVRLQFADFDPELPDDVPLGNDRFARRPREWQ